MAQEQIRQFIEQATQSIQSGQFEGGLQLLDQALALAPDDPDAHLLRGICLSQTGQPAAATDAFNRAIALDPNSAKARYNLAVHQYALGQKLDALNSARAAAQIDPTHAGARQLIGNLEAEISGPSPQSAPNPNDPLAQPAAPPIPQAPTAIPQAPQAPQANPYAAPTEPREPAMPAAPPTMAPNVPPQVPSMAHNPYAKPAYEGPEHTIPLVENMGKAWIGIGWFMALLSLVGMITGVLMVVEAFNSVGINDPDAFARSLEVNTGLVWISRIAGYGSLLGIMVWSIMDIIDRRGNFVWLIPNIICSCCGFGWLTLPIYILAGRNK